MEGERRNSSRHETRAGGENLRYKQKIYYQMKARRFDTRARVADLDLKPFLLVFSSSIVMMIR